MGPKRNSEPLSQAAGFDAEGALCYFKKGVPIRQALLSSSMAEHSAVNRRVVGSSPT